MVSCLNMGGPSSKANFYLLIVNQYREGKAKRTPGEGSEKEPETVYVQAVGAQAPV